MSEKWWDMSDDELDDLFREASDKAEIPFDSSALDKLKQKIDFKPTPEPEPSQGFKKRWLALAGLLLFFGVALLYTFLGKKEDSKKNINSDKIAENTLPSSVNNKKSEVIFDKHNSSETKESKSNSTNINVIESKIAQNKNLNSTDKKSYGQIDKKAIRRTYSSNKKILTQENSNIILEDKSLKNNPLDISNNKTTDEKAGTDISELNNNNSMVIEENNNSNEAKSVTKFSETKSKKSKNKKLKINSNEDYNQSIYSETNASMATSVIISENKPTEEETITKTNFYNVDFLTNKVTKSLETNIESESPTYVNAPPIVMKQPKFSRFGVRLAIAPDINSLERLSTSALGSSMGLLLEYRFSKKFILQTGVTFSDKKYTGNFDDYHYWTNNWKSYHPSKPTSVDGGCKIIDVPINIRFNIYQKPRNTFFISTGVSTYFMMNETYTYTYAWAPERTVEWNDKSSFYWSTVNISAGIERKLTKHFTFQIEPYLKMPLSNIGRGGVNLYSSGLLFSTKYEF